MMTKSPFDGFIEQHDYEVDGTPVRTLSASELGVQDRDRLAEYTHVPAAAYCLFPPHARLLLAVLFALRTYPQSCPDGWVKLGGGLARRFFLTDKDVRRRAVAALEREGSVDVQRRTGACTRLRLKGQRG
jgi:hypothetical protein